MPVKVVVACGSGVATSQTVASKVNRMLKADGVDAQVEAVDLKSVERHLKGAAAYGLPQINGIAFLTGMNQKAEYQKLIDAIKNFKQ